MREGDCTPIGHGPRLAQSSWLKEWFNVLKSESGAMMETDLEETPTGWVARYLIVSKDLGQMKPQRQLFASKADAVAWLSAEATAHGFIYEPPV